MKKKQKFLKPSFVLLLFFTFSILVIGCGDKDTTKANTEKTESKQLIEKNSLNANNEAEVIRVDASGTEGSQEFPVEDEIHLDKWMQLVKDIKSTLGEMDKESKQVLRTSEPR